MIGGPTEAQDNSRVREDDVMFGQNVDLTFERKLVLEAPGSSRDPVLKAQLFVLNCPIFYLMFYNQFFSGEKPSLSTYLHIFLPIPLHILRTSYLFRFHQFSLYKRYL